jgi:hypothetical protein
MTRATLVLLFASAVATGCSSSDPVWNASVRQLVLSESGGFAPPSQPTADCPHEGSEYTLVVANRMLSAWRCTPGPDAPHPLRKDATSRMLTQAEFDALVPTLKMLEVVDVDTCGADKSEVLVTLTTSSGTTAYADSFYACDDNDPRPALETNTLGQVARALGQLSFTN